MGETHNQELGGVVKQRRGGDSFQKEIDALIGSEQAEIDDGGASRIQPEFRAKRGIRGLWRKQVWDRRYRGGCGGAVREPDGVGVGQVQRLMREKGCRAADRSIAQDVLRVGGKENGARGSCGRAFRQ